MPNLKEILARLVLNVEEEYDLLKYRLRERFGRRNAIIIQPYRGFGTREELILKGRVLENPNLDADLEDDTWWDNLVNMYKRFASKEIPYARVAARYGAVEREVQANVEGFFEAHLPLDEPPPADTLWHTVHLELLAPVREEETPATAEGLVLVPPPGSEFGVISDIDDTVLQTHGTELLKFARTVFLGNARTRLPFHGIAAFYRALLLGGDARGLNPIFYVSSSPWNMYDLLVDFFQLQNIPLGPVLFLRDWGLNEEGLLPTSHRSHKMKAIRLILETCPDLAFILIGDSTQEDPEIYAETLREFPGRVPAIYIRTVNPSPARLEALAELAEQVVRDGSTLILADDTLPMAEHAAEQGWIPPEMLDEVRAEAAKDAGPAGAVEKVLEEEATVHVPAETAGGAGDEVEEVLEEKKKAAEPPPTVIVEPEDED